jgi:hypothetical protein
LGTRNQDSRRSTRLPLHIPVIVTALASESDLHTECTTVFVNAHGCAVIVPEPIKSGTPVLLKLVSNGSSKEGRVVLAISLPENFSFLLGVEFDSPGNFWEVDKPPADWGEQVR